jgi:hypothetical protein
MAGSFAFLFGVHNHQPIGNFRDVFEKAFADAYRPFLKSLLRHSGVRVTAHYSGPLLEFMEAHEKETWGDLQELVGRGQVELLGGGFYEPILTIIPEEDRQGQLRMMGDYLAEKFGRRPRGAWLAERVWEPSLPKTLARAGIEYTLLDEEHFHYAGAGRLHEFYLTEDEGFPLKVFPIDKRLRYLIPFREIGDVEAHFQKIAAAGGIAILGDDGEKFGLWPGTKDWVYGRGWLERFLDFLQERGVRTLSFSETLDAGLPAGRVYLPPASYEEMMGWALEPEDAARLEALKAKAPAESRRFLRGGFFREFFKKYPESDHLHKRMLYVSRRIRRHGLTAAGPDLYRAQGNDPYWHGVFGGLYLPHLREAAYGYLLRAEARLPPEGTWAEADFDLDGRTEILGRDGRFGVVVRPSAGGNIVEIDDYALFRNLTDVLGRRPERYHLRREPSEPEGKSIHELSKKLPPDAERLTRCDPRPRWSSIDRFLGPGERPRKGGALATDEKGDFFDQPYEYDLAGRVLRLTRRGSVRFGTSVHRLRLEKEIRLDPAGIRVAARIRNEGTEEANFLYAPEWNLRQIAAEAEIGKDIVFLCGGRLALTFTSPSEIWTEPLETLSQSEEGFDVILQGICLRPVWDIALKGGGVFEAQTVLAEKGKAG